ncbi:uncharacterized protein LOC129308399 isoform X2 [Prosopis cineraria]|uniref:uncharacterized protein LOC129300205 isoform X2 n=1 Tax=Prosopis cineraria TaxID=364024 RepID=UPI00240FFE88|nr:uncharacterized protein LOC129300205 isoform X2 [Prosopis cineraria]XP_054805484.1 uncharacterized protein LOC129308399 isoform X2 [Prosopis cineraria]
MAIANLLTGEVIANFRLCIYVYDIRSIEGGFIFPDDGAATYTYHLDSLVTFMCQCITCPIHPILTAKQKIAIKARGFGILMINHVLLMILMRVHWIMMVLAQFHGGMRREKLRTSKRQFKELKASPDDEFITPSKIMPEVVAALWVKRSYYF